MNNYLDYLCCVYDVCFVSKESRANDRLALGPNKFYDPPSLADRQYQSAGPLSIYTTTKQPQADSDKSLKLHSSDWDVVPKSCSAGDWLMRYTENETNFHPWSVDAKFSYFELVPWRQQKSRVDLIHDEGWERSSLNEDNRQQLRKLQKFEIKRFKRLHKQRKKLEKLRAKRHFKIKLILSFELNGRNMKMFSPKLETRKFVHRDQHVFVFDNRCFNLDEHWGYFSQRNKGVEELLVKGQHLKVLADYRKLVDGSHGDLPCITNGDRVFREVPCDKCRDRWVPQAKTKMIHSTAAVRSASDSFHFRFCLLVGLIAASSMKTHQSNDEGGGGGGGVQ